VGACVETTSRGNYTSKDLGFINGNNEKKAGLKTSFVN